MTGYLLRIYSKKRYFSQFKCVLMEDVMDTNEDYLDSLLKSVTEPEGSKEKEREPILESDLGLGEDVGLVSDLGLGEDWV